MEYVFRKLSARIANSEDLILLCKFWILFRPLLPQMAYGAIVFAQQQLLSGYDGNSLKFGKFRWHDDIAAPILRLYPNRTSMEGVKEFLADVPWPGAMMTPWWYYLFKFPYMEEHMTDWILNGFQCGKSTESDADIEWDGRGFQRGRRVRSQ
ncbi:hypothetical protein M011DRAFT_206785 [Sporormia fimetaria CBS 119925]|uniref:Uncharacterized protein n=1 Tax=Sporormia fimetaria CBS 119925 TaxID=1340428 RepID=A0A6A6V2C9_9PLEO|nr:hypothetical protein M011DRAFT_206785 [Sporormia fimetaria CBS 119925]